MAALDAYLRAIKGIESSGRYDAVGPTHPKYGRALGGYQIMESNLPSWSKAAVGREVSPDEFLKNPQLQDAIAKNRFSGYADKYGLDNAASMWHSGRPLAQAQGAADSLGTRTPDYVRRVAEAAGKDTGGDTQIAYNPQADVPAEGAVETGGPAPSNDSGGFLSGLFGPNWSASDAMIGAGASLMARDNPTGAQALAAQLTKRNNALGKSVLKTDPKTGMGVIFDPTTGKTSTQQLFPRTEEPDLPGTGDQKLFQENLDKANAHYRMSEVFDKARKDIANGDMDLSVLAKAKQSATELFNQQLTPQQLKAVQFAVEMENARSDILTTWKGVQTEGDAKRAMDMLMPGAFGRYSNDAIMSAMERGYARSGQLYDQAMKNNDALYNRYSKSIAPSDYAQTYQDRKDYLKRSEDDYAPLKESYTKKRATVSQEKAAGITGRPQDAKPSSGGFLQHFDNKNK